MSIPFILTLFTSLRLFAHDDCERHLWRVLSRAPTNVVSALATRLPGTIPTFIQLDRTYRRGWRRVGVPDARGESVYRHTRRLIEAVINYQKDPRLQRRILMATIHDFPERTVKDYTPHDAITAAEKFSQEDEAMVKLTAALGPDANFIYRLWREFDARETRDALVVQQLDKLAAAVQALEYERQGYDVAQVFTSVDAHVEDAHLRRTLEALLKRRGDSAVDFHALYFSLLRETSIPR